MGLLGLEKTRVKVEGVAEEEGYGIIVRGEAGETERRPRAGAVG